LESHANFDDVAKVYGLNLSDELRGLSLDSAFKQLLNKPPVIGDSVELGHFRMTIQEMDESTILMVSLKLLDTVLVRITDKAKRPQFSIGIRLIATDIKDHKVSVFFGHADDLVDDIVHGNNAL